MEYIKLIDVTKCTGCRGCQVACKQWNNLPAEEKPMFTGSLQNPKDLAFNSWCLIRFDEIEVNGKLKWLMRHDACMHCENPACAKACPSPGALVKTEEGPVIHDPKYCIGCKACTSACPFDVPRHNKEIEKMAKCSMCHNRITEGKIPACAMACPTGCITFGTKEKMEAAAEKRAEKIEGYVYPSNPKYPTNMLYVFPKDVKVADFSHANPNPGMPASILWWKNLFKPFTLIGIGGVAAASFMHYIIKGPHKVHEKKEEGGE